ncbi:MAG: sugar kinase [Kiritimatiellae bacterium]|nr:sugar kinase [Kiritimatiellia bacterium]
MKTIVTFGEIMGRLTPEGSKRFSQAMPGRLEWSFGGAEANVAVAIARWDGKSSFVTALPDSEIGAACIANLRGYGVDLSHVVTVKGSRLGLYFLETGANQRSSQVIYDRDASAICTVSAGCYAWKHVFSDAGWFHISGITPSLSSIAAEAALTAAAAARHAGCTVSCDLNYRKKLWRWQTERKPGELAREVMGKLLTQVDVAIANEEDIADVFGIHAEDTDVHAGKVEAGRYPDVARRLCAAFPGLKQVAITLRESVSASHNNWGAMLYDRRQDQARFAPTGAGGDYRPYQIHSIVDRVGSGDSFAAGLIFALNTPELSEAGAALRYAAAASCLAHSVVGDFALVSRAEVEALANGQASGRVQR